MTTNQNSTEISSSELPSMGASSLLSFTFDGKRIICRSIAVSPSSDYTILEGYTLDDSAIRYAIVSHKSVILSCKKLQRSFELGPSAISDMGSYALTVEHFDDAQGHLVNHFQVFSENGTMTAEYVWDYVPNIVALSTDGEFATLCACNYAKIFNVRTGESVADFDLHAGRVQNFTLDVQNKVVSLKYIDRLLQPIIRYTFDGTCLDEEIYLQSNSNGFEVYANILHRMDQEKLPLEPVAALSYAAELEHCFTLEFYGYQVARAYRQLGDLYLQGNKMDCALVAYEKAISSDPKIGVKKKILQLKKDLGIS